MSERYLLCLCTTPDDDTARRLAGALVEHRLAACVNVLGPIRSVYRWQGAVEEAEERLLLIKTVADRFEALQAAVRAQHPYELPELIAVPIEQGLSAYLQWVHDNTRDGTHDTT